MESMPLSMMKHLEDDVPPVFMILDTFDKDIKVRFRNVGRRLGNFNFCMILFIIFCLFFMFRIIIFITSFLQSSVSIIIVVVDKEGQSLKDFISPSESDAWDPPVLRVRRQLVPVCPLLPAVPGCRPPGYGLCRDHQDHRGKARNQEERA